MNVVLDDRPPLVNNTEMDRTRKEHTTLAQLLISTSYVKSRFELFKKRFFSTVYLFIGIECTMHLYLYFFFSFSKNKTDKYANII